MHFQHATDAFTLKNGVKIPCIGFGTWQSADGPTAENAVREAIEAGYRHIGILAAVTRQRSKLSKKRFLICSSTTLTSTSSIGRLRLRALQTGRNSTLKPGVLSLSSIRLDASVLSASPISARRTLSR